MPDPTDPSPEVVPFEVYYDGGCPACRREMAHYRAQPSAVAIRFTDVVAEPERLVAIGITQREAIHRLHARDEQGRLLVGMRAFLGVWLRIPRYAGIARRLEWLITSRPMEWLYARFCNFRLPRRCRNGACGLEASSVTRQEGR
jgi:predicted DCC family thiol-disulfide oxidoreductase YuxK